MTKRVHIKKFGGVEGLSVDEIELDAPAAGEVNIAVEAIGINRGDILLRQDLYIESPKLPSRISYDAAARVTAVGEGVTGFAVGDKVMTIPAFLQSDYGVCGEDVNVPAEALWPWPDSMSAEEAACVGVQYTTVYIGIHHVAATHKGDLVLLPAATGAVGLAAVEVARELGLETIATTRTADKRDLIASRGAQHVVVTNDENLAARVQEISNGNGVKAIFDPIAGKSIETSIACIANDGHVVLYGALDLEDARLPVTELIGKNATISAYTVFAYVGSEGLGYHQNKAVTDDARDFLVPRLSDGRLKPIVSKVFDLEEVKDAHTYLDDARPAGKVVLRTKHYGANR